MQVRFGSFLSAVSNKPNESEKAGHLSVDLPRSELHRQKREERVEAVSELDLKEFPLDARTAFSEGRYRPYIGRELKLDGALAKLSHSTFIP